MRAFFSLRYASALLLLMASAPSAFADNVFLLQLGTTTSRESAEAVYQEVREKHEELLGKYRFVPREVKNGEDDSNNWRVQVGVFETRSKAYKTCAELKMDGTECVVVETAALTENDRTQLAREQAPMPAPAAKSEPVPEPRPEAKPEPVVVAAAEPKEEAPKEKAAPAPEAEKEPAREQASNEGETSVWPWNWFDGESAPVAEAAEEKPAPKVEEVQVAEKAAPLAEVRASTPAPVEPAASEPTSAPMEIIPPPPGTKLLGVIPVQRGQPPVAAKEPAPTPYVEQRAPKNLITPAEREAPQKEIVRSSGKTRKGKVEVAEAIPVPLTEGTRAPLPPLPKGEARATTITSERIPATGYRGGSSAPAGRALQIGPFNGEDNAFACWRSMRASDESLNGLRNRVVKSRLYSAGSDEAMLRVSPVATEELASRICTLARGCGGEDIQCRIIAEQNPQALTLQQAPVTSLSSSPAVQLSRRDAERRMVRGGDASTGQLWVQLGSAASQGRAAQRFETLQQQHEDLLGGYVADISTPPRVGLARTIYRLRVGPFTARGAADQLCNKLEARNVSCLVVTE